MSAQPLFKIFPVSDWVYHTPQRGVSGAPIAMEVRAAGDQKTAAARHLEVGEMRGRGAVAVEDLDPAHEGRRIQDPLDLPAFVKEPRSAEPRRTYVLSVQ